MSSESTSWNAQPRVVSDAAISRKRYSHFTEKNVTEPETATAGQDTLDNNSMQTMYPSANDETPQNSLPVGESRDQQDQDPASSVRRRPNIRENSNQIRDEYLCLQENNESQTSVINSPAQDEIDIAANSQSSENPSQNPFNLQQNTLECRSSNPHLMYAKKTWCKD